MLGMRLKRLSAGKTLADVASAIGVADNTVWRWETKDRTPSVAMLRKLAEFFNCSMDELLCEDAENPPQPSAEESGAEERQKPAS